MMSQAILHSDHRKPVYTTAGTVYRPALTTLQRPARRARSIKYDLLLRPLSDSAAPTHAHSDHHPHTSPFHNKQSASPRHISYTIYSPLQQNYERAISPSVASQQVQRRQSYYNYHRYNIAAMSPSNSSSFGMFDVVDGRIESPEMLRNEPSSAENILNKGLLSVKAMNSLASYPNKAQLAAKQTLAKARLPMALLTNGCRAQTPSSLSQASSDSQALEHVETTSLTESLTSILIVTRASERPSAPGLVASQSLQADDQSGLDHGGRDRTSRASGQFTTLSTGPGAPQPLTAGPPGHRHYTPTIRASARTEKADPSSTSNIQATQIPNASQPEFLPALFDSAMPHSWSSRSSSMSTSDGYDLERAPVDVGQGSTHISSSRILDTLDPQSVRKYYPDGLPSDYTGQYEPIPQDWAEEYPESLLLLGVKSRTALARRNAWVSNHFYAGLYRQLEYMTDSTDNSSSSGLSSPEIQRSALSDEEASARETTEFLGVLLKMTLDALAGHEGDNGKWMMNRPSRML